jgi:hypothetical protein
MSNELLAQLAEVEVPPPPPQFDTELHTKLNRSLAMQQLFDFAFSAIPLAALELARAVIAMLTVTVSGKFPNQKK